MTKLTLPAAILAAILAAGVAALADPPKNNPRAPTGSVEDTHPELKKNPNLVANGDFEKGTEGVGPDHWQQVDGLTSFWVKDADPAHGMVMKFDTDVLQSQGYDWWTEIRAGRKTAKDAPKKLPTVEPKYDTLAGLDGVWFYSDFVPIKKGKSYWLTLDVKGPGIMCWLMGYADKKDVDAAAKKLALTPAQTDALRHAVRMADPEAVQTLLADRLGGTALDAFLAGDKDEDEVTAVAERAGLKEEEKEALTAAVAAGQKDKIVALLKPKLGAAEAEAWFELADAEFGADQPAFLEGFRKRITGKEPDRSRGFKAFKPRNLWKGQLTAGGGDAWKTYSRQAMPFRPTTNTPKVKYVRAYLLPFWPPGEYYVDNVRLVEFDEGDD